MHWGKVDVRLVLSSSSHNRAKIHTNDFRAAVLLKRSRNSLLAVGVAKTYAFRMDAAVGIIEMGIRMRADAVDNAVDEG
jgi:hypothetical protein